MNNPDTQTILNLVEILKGVKSLLGVQNPYLPVYSALGGAFVGAVATFIPNAIAACLKERRERKTLTLALYAEISAIVELIRLRCYVEHLQTIIKSFRDGAFLNRTYQVIVPEDFCIIFKSSASKIGSLNPYLLVKMVRFYQLLDAAIQDVKPGRILNIAPRGAPPFEQLLVIVENMLVLGQEITHEIEEKYKLKRSPHDVAADAQAPG